MPALQDGHCGEWAQTRGLWGPHLICAFICRSSGETPSLLSLGNEWLPAPSGLFLGGRPHPAPSQLSESVPDTAPRKGAPLVTSERDQALFEAAAVSWSCRAGLGSTW